MKLGPAISHTSPNLSPLSAHPYPPPFHAIETSAPQTYHTSPQNIITTQQHCLTMKRLYHEMPVCELMSPDVITVDYLTPVNEAAALMDEHKIGSMVITKDGDPVGLITERDVTEQIVAENITPHDRTVAEIMSYPLHSVKTKENVYAASERMSKEKIRRLLVIDDGDLKGIITECDIVRSAPQLFSTIREAKDARFLEESQPETMRGRCEVCGVFCYDLYESDGRLICESCHEQEE